MNIKNTLFSILLSGILFSAKAQYVSILSFGSGYSQDFNTLDTSGTALANIPSGWWIAESPGNFTYRAGNGSSNSGDTYSFGSPSSSDRALGSVASGTVVSNFGSRYINNTGSAITSFSINLTMEQWRSGGRTSLDSLTFLYLINGGVDSAGFVKVNAATWTRRITGDLVSKVTQATAATLDGNLPINKQSYSFTITGITVNNGDTLYLRWRDPNLAGSDDGLAIDDYTFTAFSGAPVTLPPTPITSLNITATSQTSLALTWTKAAGYVDSTMSTLVFVKEATAITQGTPSAIASTYTADTNFLGTGTLYQHDLLAKCVYNADGNTVAIGNLNPNIRYHVLVYTIRNTDTVYSLGVVANLKTLPVPGPSSITTTLFSTTTKTTTTLSWIKPVDYIDSTMTTLVFLKQTTAVTIGIPTFNASTYIANANFTLATSTYQNDAAAKCVLNNDQNILNITGLSPGTNYHALIYVVRNSDSSYSNSTSASIQTLAIPAPVTALSFTAKGQTTATINWTKASGYSDSTMSTLVFVKEATAITQGVPTAIASAYVADSNFVGSGSLYQHDALAKCVFNGDENKVSLSNLTSNTVYHILVYTIRNADTTYSAAEIDNEKTFGATPPPAAIKTLASSTIGLTNATLSWTLDSTYRDSSMTVVVYMKKGTNITLGNPINAPQTITGNAILGLGSIYENDSQATCVYKGDGLQVEVVGLTANTDYALLAYVINDADTLYSSERVFSIKTISYPSPLAGISISNKSQTGFTVNWIKPLNFDSTNNRIVLFAKKATPSFVGVPTFAAANYSANTIFGLGTIYQNDTASFCVYNGVSSSLAITGLTAATTYSIVSFVIRNSDSAYSGAASAIDSTLLGNPTSSTSVTLIGTSQTTARINWTKPTEYNNATYTTLVFVKEGNINLGKPNKNSLAYNANTTLGLGSRFDADSSAYCVFKGDTTVVNITALKSNTAYQVFVFVMRDIDSLSSTAAIGNGNSQGPPPLYTIGQINKTNLNTGVPDSLNVKATIRGTVYGFNQRVTGIQILVRDTTGGITLFNASKNFGYTTVNEGDVIEATGTVATFRGLTQLVLDTIMYSSTGATIETASKVSILNESIENKLVRLDSVRFVSTPSGLNWPTSSTNFLVITATNDTTIIRLLSTSQLAGKPFPSTPQFSVTGMGAQFSTSAAAPFLFNGYQLFPRTQNDITEVVVIPDTLSAFDLLSPVNNDTIEITNANLGDSITISWSASFNSDGISATEYSFLLDTLGGDFSNPFIVIPSGNNTFIKLTKEDILTEILEPNSITYGNVFALDWMVEASSSTIIKNSTQIFTVYIRNSLTTGLTGMRKMAEFKIWPNPATGYFSIKGIEPNNEIDITDITGKVLLSQKVTATEMEIPITDFKSGLYFVKVKTNHHVSIQKLLVN
jgi:hypothetical protein